ncbi:MAG: hypothetical protein Q7S48_04985 [bacterium]|nr:hypothetical protein [bacterium]
MPKSENAGYRQQLAAELKAAPKENQRDILDKAQQDPEYWQSKSERAIKNQEETSTDDCLGVFIKHKTLYHGTGITNIKIFKPAEETTVGEGVYLTSQAKGAIGYSIDRSKGTDKEPHIYETVVENVKLLDLRNDANVQQIVPGFRILINSKLAQVTDKDPWYVKHGLLGILDEIDGNKVKVGWLKLIAQSEGKLFSEYVQSLGYDGLIAIEGGESEHTEDHDTYLIFDPEKIKIKGEHKIVRS